MSCLLGIHESKHEAYGLHLWYRFDVTGEIGEPELDRQHRVIAALDAIEADEFASSQVLIFSVSLFVNYMLMSPFQNICVLLPPPPPPSLSWLKLRQKLNWLCTTLTIPILRNNSTTTTLR